MAERRTESRNRSYKGARIVFNNGASTIDCLVSDRGAHGAHLKLANTLGIPDAFDLLTLAENTSRRCRVVWRSTSGLGVEYEGR